MVMRRKEPKSYGMKKLVEGTVVPGHRCIIIDDVSSSGESFLETAKDLRAVGLVVTDAVVLLDRQATGTANLADQGIRLHPALNLSQICGMLVKHGQLSAEIAQQVEVFMVNSRKPKVGHMSIVLPPETNGKNHIWFFFSFFYFKPAQCFVFFIFHDFFYSFPINFLCFFYFHFKFLFFFGEFFVFVQQNR